MTKKEIEKEIYKLRSEIGEQKANIFAYLFLICIILLFVNIILSITLYDSVTNNESTTNKEFFHDYNFINKIKQDCGSTFLVKKDKCENNWTVFKQVCKDGGYCKHKYVCLEDCLK